MERQHSARWKHWHSKRSCSTESHACAGQATTWFAQIETGTVSAARTRAFAMLIWWKLAKLRWHRARSYYIYLYIQSLLTTHVVWITGSAQMGPERAADATDTTPSHHVTSCYIMSHHVTSGGGRRSMECKASFWCRSHRQLPAWNQLLNNLNIATDGGPQTLSYLELSLPNRLTTFSLSSTFRARIKWQQFQVVLWLHMTS